MICVVLVAQRKSLSEVAKHPKNGTSDGHRISPTPGLVANAAKQERR